MEPLNHSAEIEDNSDGTHQIFLKVPQENTGYVRTRSQSKESKSFKPETGSYKAETGNDYLTDKCERTEPDGKCPSLGKAEGKSLQSEFDLLDFPIKTSPSPNHNQNFEDTL